MKHPTKKATKKAVKKPIKKVPGKGKSDISPAPNPGGPPTGP